MNLNYDDYNSQILLSIFRTLSDVGGAKVLFRRSFGIVEPSDVSKASC